MNKRMLIVVIALFSECHTVLAGGGVSGGGIFIGTEGRQDVAQTETVVDVSSNNNDYDTVKRIQEKLNERGYDCGVADGIMGQKTSTAISTYQSSEGLSVTGTITEELIDSLTNNNINESAEIPEKPFDYQGPESEKKVADFYKGLSDENANDLSLWITAVSFIGTDKNEAIESKGLSDYDWKEMGYTGSSYKCDTSLLGYPGYLQLVCGGKKIEQCLFQWDILDEQSNKFLLDTITQYHGEPGTKTVYKYLDNVEYEWTNKDYTASLELGGQFLGPSYTVIPNEEVKQDPLTPEEEAEIDRLIEEGREGIEWAKQVNEDARERADAIQQALNEGS